MADKPRQKGKEDIEGLLKSLEQNIQQLHARGPNMQLYDSNGKLVYRNLVRLLEDPQYEEFRKRNPGVVKEAKYNLNAAVSNRVGRAALTAGKLGFGLDQMRRAKAISETPPAFPRRPKRSLALQREIASAQSDAATGMSPIERAMAEQGLLDSYRKSRNDIIQTSGGQSSGAQTNLQVAARNNQRQRRALAAQAQQMRRQNRAQLGSLLNTQQNESARLQQFDQNRFRMREMPIYQNRMAAKERLMNAGLTNAFRAGDQLFGDAIATANLFNTQMPGYIPPNASFGAGDDPLEKIFDNPLNYMRVDMPSLPEMEGLGQRQRGIPLSPNNIPNFGPIVNRVNVNNPPLIQEDYNPETYNIPFY